jgi:hypothetical protein
VSGKSFKQRLTAELDGVVSFHHGHAAVESGFDVLEVFVGRKMTRGLGEAPARRVASENHLGEQLRSGEVASPA